MFSSSSMFVAPGNDYSIVLYYGILNPGVSHDDGKKKMLEVLNEAIETSAITKKDLESYINMYMFSNEKWKMTLLLWQNICANMKH